MKSRIKETERRGRQFVIDASCSGDEKLEFPAPQRIFERKKLEARASPLNHRPWRSMMIRKPTIYCIHGLKIAHF
jgi:hypothetical protein